MNCPACKTAKLSMTERCGIEIDYCPECRGVWLDRGELDKIISAGRSEMPQQTVIHDHHKYSQQKHYKRKSFLEELFD